MFKFKMDLCLKGACNVYRYCLVVCEDTNQFIHLYYLVNLLLGCISKYMKYKSVLFLPSTYPQCCMICDRAVNGDARFQILVITRGLLHGDHVRLELFNWT